jgi:hypothetical protein
MPGLTDDVAVIGIPEKPKKHIRSTEIELQAWRKLDENRSQLVTQPSDFAKKAQQGFLDIAEPTFVRDGLRHLDGEPEVVGDIIRPALVSR